MGATEEDVTDGDTEVWEIYNTTGDVHPMHFHLVNVQVINRQSFDAAAAVPTLFTGPVIPPDPNELGWKETVPMYPGTVTRVIMKFDLPQIVDSMGSPSTRRPAACQLPITNGSRPPARGPAATSTCGTATSWSTKSTT